MVIFRTWSKRMILAGLACLFTIALSTPSFSHVRLSGLFGNSMVIQRNRPVKVWGWADKDERVTVHFNGVIRTAMPSAEGKWSVTFPPLKEGGPCMMRVQGRNTICIDDIMAGDLWVCSGQSNMEWNVAQSQNGARETAQASHPGIRLFTVPKNLTCGYADDVQGAAWKVCSPETAGKFSATGYYFGREIHRAVNVPVGLINSSWGGTNIEAWTSGDYLARIDGVKCMQTLSPEEIKKRNDRELESLRIRFGLNTPEPLNADGWCAERVDLTFWQNIEVPGIWEQKGFGEMDGVMWFRKEITIPAGLCKGHCSLLLGKIDDSDRTYVNGRLVGETEGMYSHPREYTISPGTFTPGRNIITVRVEDTGGGGGFWSSPSDMKLICGLTEIPLAGTWKCRLSPEKLSIGGGNGGNPNTVPSGLYNGMIHPLLGLPITGVIWYQGEADASQAFRYKTLFPLMINCWRDKWKDPAMPFLFVQLANYMDADQAPADSEWAELREAQAQALSLPRTGMAVAIDIGDAKDIHPLNKQEVGRRLALNALKVAYGKNVVCSGPAYKSMHVEGDSVIIDFENSPSPMVVKDRYGYVKGFAVAGPDRKFHWAKAWLDRNRVVARSGKVQNPMAVRYGWGNNPDDVNLYNQDNLPASPFRSDDWPGITK